ncbi:MAG: hypothetical protein PHF46_01560 [Candidatus Gracilibacteria bacterium]|nr:hypothetical protein [Candidatus Gracilibacteria bacterium]MDD3120079.1 hypothetical protein [Candidatus Gracilibacteria bacterium]MDD4530283.1 hypothetical protein [Candidatus Gracilibacteria bacterium]
MNLNISYEVGTLENPYSSEEYYNECERQMAEKGIITFKGYVSFEEDENEDHKKKTFYYDVTRRDSNENLDNKLPIEKVKKRILVSVGLVTKSGYVSETKEGAISPQIHYEVSCFIPESENTKEINFSKEKRNVLNYDFSDSTREFLIEKIYKFLETNFEFFETGQMKQEVIDAFIKDVVSEAVEKDEIKTKVVITEFRNSIMGVFFNKKTRVN